MCIFFFSLYPFGILHKSSKKSQKNLHLVITLNHNTYTYSNLKLAKYKKTNFQYHYHHPTIRKYTFFSFTRKRINICFFRGIHSVFKNYHARCHRQINFLLGNFHLLHRKKKHEKRIKSTNCAVLLF